MFYREKTFLNTMQQKRKNAKNAKNLYFSSSSCLGNNDWANTVYESHPYCYD
jgi:hypothetical protein